MNNQMLTIREITNKLAIDLEPNYYLLRCSFRCLSIWEIFQEILKSRDVKFEVKFLFEKKEEMKAKLIGSLSKEYTSNNPNQEIVESFYIGQIVATLNHGNVPININLSSFGKVMVVDKDLDSWHPGE